jgi:hypothetical protein
MIIFGISFAMILINKSVFRPLTNLNF